MKFKTSLIHGRLSATNGQNFEHASWVALHERINLLRGIHVEHHMRISFGRNEGRINMPSIEVYNNSYSRKHAVRH